MGSGRAAVLCLGLGVVTFAAGLGSGLAQTERGGTPPPANTNGALYPTGQKAVPGQAVFDADVQLQQAQEQIDKLKASNVELKRQLEATQGGEAHAPAAQQNGWMSTAVPLGACFLALGAIVWSLISRSSSNRELRRMEARREKLSDQIAALEKRLRSFERPGAKGGEAVAAVSGSKPLASDVRRKPVSAARPAPTRQAEDHDPDVLRPRKLETAKSSQISSAGRRKPTAQTERSETLRPPAPAARPVSDAVTAYAAPISEEPPAEVDMRSYPSSAAAETPAADPRQKSGDVQVDYNRARAMGQDGEDWFKASYRCVGLSCVNLNELRKDPGAVLHFEESGRGLFLGIEQVSGQVLVVPALDKDFDAARTSLEGVFHYGEAPSGAARLLRAASASYSGGVWTLREPGGIGLG